MKLTTDKALIVYYDEFDKLYKFCGIRRFKTYYNYGSETPILYTSSIYVARETTQKLNKNIIKNT